jgi:endonuclease YncB( thermonuclease family)
MASRRILVALMLILSNDGAIADDLIGQASIVDGDTLEIHGTRIRLWGIDAPESSQLYRMQAMIAEMSNYLAQN